MQFFSQFCQNPDGVTFEEQEKDETVLLFLRRHFITNVPWLAGTIVLFLLPLLLPLLLPIFEMSLFTIPQRYLTTLTSFYYLIIFGYALTSFISWFYNVGMVTSKRIIDIDFSSITAKNVTTIPLEEEDIDNVEFQQNGFFQTFFDYGNVVIETKGKDPQVTLEKVPHPTRVSRILIELLEQNKHS